MKKTKCLLLASIILASNFSPIVNNNFNLVSPVLAAGNNNNNEPKTESLVSILNFQ